MNSTPLIFILYDSITNSVFESQVKNLLQKKVTENPYRPVHLVTFEPDTQNIKIDLKSIRVTYLKRIPFIGFVTIWHATKQLKSFLRLFPEYSIIARGPIAGVIAQRSIKKTACTQFIIQARGLLAQEYNYIYANKKTSTFAQLAHRFRAAQLSVVEMQAYRPNPHIAKTIEAVSPALRDRLIDAYNADLSTIAIATQDIPQVIDQSQKKTWRAATRSLLSIPEDWTVYCYNGSAKAWQKPNDIVTFFKDILEKNPNSFLLILSKDKLIFQTLIGESINSKHYALISVKHEDVYQYLCGTDYGLLFRDEHIINWISRPTKALEYRAAGLKIIHNNTVAYLNTI